MDEINEIEIYKKSIESFGSELSLDILIENCGKLIESLIKWKRGTINYNEVIKNSVDVKISLCQLEQIINIPIEFKRAKRQALNKLRGEI